MLLVSVTAPVLATCCYVLARGRGEPCVVVDPGIGVGPQLTRVLEDLDLRPAALLVTHGHADHVWGVPQWCRADVPVLVHDADRPRLTDPLGDLGPQLRPVLAAEMEAAGAPAWTPPEHVRGVHDGQELELAGVELTVRHAPGHTQGSVLLELGDIPEQVNTTDLTRTVLTGDVLFAGSIGRTDLPGGDAAAMERTLRDVVLPLGDPSDALVLPGHGPASTLHRERATNPYLR